MGKTIVVKSGGYGSGSKSYTYGSGSKSYTDDYMDDEFSYANYAKRNYPSSVASVPALSLDVKCRYVTLLLFQGIVSGSDKILDDMKVSDLLLYGKFDYEDLKETSAKINAKFNEEEGSDKIELDPGAQLVLDYLTQKNSELYINTIKEVLN